jgi:hypothetical protein
MGHRNLEDFSAFMREHEMDYLRTTPLPRCRCRRVDVQDECLDRVASPDSWLCSGCEERHRPDEPGSPYTVEPL